MFREKLVQVKWTGIIEEVSVDQIIYIHLVLVRFCVLLRETPVCLQVTYSVLLNIFTY